MWTTIAEGSSTDEFEASTTTRIRDLPKGTPLLYHIEVMPGLGKLADLAGAEFLAQYFVPRGITVEDVYGDWTWAEIRATVDPPLGPLAAVAAIVVALSALGIVAMVTYILLKADVLPLLGILPVWALIAGGLSGGYLLYYFFTRRPSPPAPPPITIVLPPERRKQ